MMKQLNLLLRDVPSHGNKSVSQIYAVVPIFERICAKINNFKGNCIVRRVFFHKVYLLLKMALVCQSFNSFAAYWNQPPPLFGMLWYFLAPKVWIVECKS